MSESRTLAKERGLDREYEVERVSSTPNKSGFQGGEGEQAKRTSLGKVGKSMSGCKSSPGGSGESWFHSKSGQI